MRAFVLLAVLTASLGCSSTEDAGIQVSFALADRTPAALRADDGRDVVLTHGSLALGSLELISCDGFTPGDTHTHAAGLQLQHVEGSPTLLGAPAVLRLDAPAAAVALGAVQPPPGRYCAVRQHYFPADDDAAGLTDPTDVGATLVTAGSVGGAAFSLRSAGTLDLDVTLATPLELSLDGTREATLELTVDETKNWLAGVSFAPGREQADADVVLAGLHHALGMRVKP